MSGAMLAFHITDRCQLNCQHCLREVGNLALHERYCYSRNVPDVLKANNYAEEMTAMADRAASLRTELDEIAIERAGAHAAPKSALRRSQRQAIFLQSALA